jgi:cell division ATPase FtsA
MKVVEVSSRRDQVYQREIPQYMLEAMDAECKQKIELHNPKVAVVALIPFCYILDGVAQEDTPAPHQRAAKIEVKYIAFVGPKELEQKVLDSFIRTPKHVERMYARPDALMCALATDEDFCDGCAILDMGAQTTTLTIFSNGKYVLNKVISQGGYDITRDIQQLGIEKRYAELLPDTSGMKQNPSIAFPLPALRSLSASLRSAVLVANSNIHIWNASIMKIIHV